MAIFKFAESILNGDSVSVFNSSKPLGRDFTYVTDVVSGIVSALDYVPHRCGEIFNLGHGETVRVDQVLKLLEEALNKTAKLVSGERESEKVFELHVSVLWISLVM